MSAPGHMSTVFLLSSFVCSYLSPKSKHHVIVSLDQGSMLDMGPESYIRYAQDSTLIVRFFVVFVFLSQKRVAVPFVYHSRPFG